MFTQKETNTMIILKSYLRGLSQSGSLKGRFWRSLLVLAISIILIFIWLRYVDKTKHLTYIISPIPKREMEELLVRSTEPRVAAFIFSEKIDELLCYSLGSAYLSGVPVVVVSYEMLYNGTMSKFDFIEEAIENVGLNLSDVVIVMDSDTLFTGVDINPFLNRFIAQSAATPENLDALAVRQGRAMAPFLANADDRCLADSMFKTRENCVLRYETVHERIRKFAAAHPEHNLRLTFDLSPQRHLNVGIVVARVWAYKEYLQKARNLIRSQPTLYQSYMTLHTDQDVATVLYLGLIKWEIKRDVFSMPLHKQQVARSPYGVRAGFIELDFVNEFSTLLEPGNTDQYELHDEHWTKYLPQDGNEHSHFHNTLDYLSMRRFITDLYRRAYTTNDDDIFTRLVVPMVVDAKLITNDETTLTLTPPLFALKLRPIDTVNNTIHRTFPAIIHIPKQNPDWMKLNLMKNATIALRWFTPMIYKPVTYFHAMEHLASTSLYLSTQNSIIRGFYFLKCHLPVEEDYYRGRAV